jgi:hypothetical protein
MTHHQFSGIDGIRSCLESLLGNMSQQPKMDFVNPEVHLAMADLVFLMPKGIENDPLLRQLTEQVGDEFASLTQDILVRLQVAASEAADRHNKDLVERLAASTWNSDRLLAECSPKLAMAVQTRRLELANARTEQAEDHLRLIGQRVATAEARAESAMAFADDCLDQLRGIRNHAYEKKHGRLARRAGGAVHRLAHRRAKF